MLDDDDGATRDAAIVRKGSTSSVVNKTLLDVRHFCANPGQPPIKIDSNDGICLITNVSMSNDGCDGVWSLKLWTLYVDMERKRRKEKIGAESEIYKNRGLVFPKFNKSGDMIVQK